MVEKLLGRVEEGVKGEDLGELVMAVTLARGGMVGGILVDWEVSLVVRVRIDVLSLDVS